MLNRSHVASLAVASLFVAQLYLAHSAHACSCALQTAAAARAAAAVVFEGRLERLEGHDGEGRARAVFQLSRVWKGSVSGSLTVEVPAQPSMCPPHLEVGETYIVYATGTESAPGVTACARYASGRTLAAERRALGAPIRRFGRRDR